MSKSANAGELRTPVYIKRVVPGTGSNGYPADREENIFGEDRYVLTKWVNAHGREVYDAMQLQVLQPATLTMRYSPLIDDTMLIYKAGDPEPFEIISMDNVNERDLWLEIKVKRRAAAR